VFVVFALCSDFRGPIHNGTGLNGLGLTKLPPHFSYIYDKSR